MDKSGPQSLRGQPITRLDIDKKSGAVGGGDVRGNILVGEELARKQYPDDLPSLMVGDNLKRSETSDAGKKKQNAFVRCVRRLTLELPPFCFLGVVSVG